MTSEQLDVVFGHYLAGFGGEALGRSLADSLAANGLMSSARLLRDYLQSGEHWTVTTDVEGPWAGRRCWVGPFNPDDPGAGDIWFDTAEVGCSVLLPRRPEQFAKFSEDLKKEATANHSWLSIRRVQTWQYAGYAISRSSLKPFDPGSAGILDPVTGLTGIQFAAYYLFFGKRSATWVTWEHAASFLPLRLLGDLWPDAAMEFGSFFDDDEVELLDRETAVLVVVDHEGPHPGSGRNVRSDNDLLENVCLRTAMPVRDGLLVPGTYATEGMEILDRDV